ncbi:antibiotic biosynthesis monooxygenase family protein [Sorangium sp. So ce426]|uniref:antibiotic biosynthesis monooxygenase family protein n=1 Tax=unclassified Sorangium TaxID=2621164 RepID=UPI003F5C1297
MTTRGFDQIPGATIARSSGALAAAVIAALGAILSGCSSDSGGKTTDAPLPELPECTGGVLEADLEADPLSGPGVDPETGKLRPPPEGSSYAVSATYGVPRPGDAVMQRYVQIFGAIQAELASQPGLLAIQLGQSPSCGSGRTLAVWASTDAMYEFVMGPAHLAAVNAADELLEPTYVVTHWETAETDGITLADSVSRIRALDARAP